MMFVCFVISGQIRSVPLELFWIRKTYLKFLSDSYFSETSLLDDKYTRGSPKKKLKVYLTDLLPFNQNDIISV